MKILDVIAATLLVVGGLNWGLVGLLEFNLIASLLGEGTAISKVVYSLVGLAAVWQVVGLKAIQSRWGVRTIPATI